MYMLLFSLSLSLSLSLSSLSLPLSLSCISRLGSLVPRAAMDLKRERLQATCNSEELAAFLHGSEVGVRARERACVCVGRSL
jgi:hypothetical protein